MVNVTIIIAAIVMVLATAGILCTVMTLMHFLDKLDPPTAIHDPHHPRNTHK